MCIKMMKLDILDLVKRLGGGLSHIFSCEGVVQSSLYRGPRPRRSYVNRGAISPLEPGSLSTECVR